MKEAPTARALLNRAMTSSAIRGPVTGEQFATDCGLPIADLFDRRGEFAGRIEMRRIGERFVVYARNEEARCWPASADIEKVVAKVRRSA